MTTDTSSPTHNAGHHARSRRVARIPPASASRGLAVTPVMDVRPTLPRPAAEVASVTRTRGTTAVVYCEANFGGIDGKTANGLVRHSEKYHILAVIDSQQAGLDAGMVLDGRANGMPILRDLADTVRHAGRVPDTFIFGIAPSSGMLSPGDRSLLLEAIGMGMHIVIGLHEFLTDDVEFAEASRTHGVEIIDVRKPAPTKDLRIFSGRILDVDCVRIAVLGTDCAIGKRTTAMLLADALNERGIKTVMVGTGQTGLMQGARYGVALDAVPSQFCAGELEATIVEAYETERPKVIIIEGQGALSHPAYSTSSFILRGSCPQAVILQHAPGRPHRCDFEQMAMPEPASEIGLIETFADTRVIGLTINHEHLDDAGISAAIAHYERDLGLPATDPLTRSSEGLVAMVLSAFPALAATASPSVPVASPVERLAVRGTAAHGWPQMARAALR